jgi:hypothetical protein
MIRLLTDFNEVDDDVAKGLVEDLESSRPLAVGDRVLLHDDGEHEMWGTVSEVRNGVISAHVEWDTWSAVSAHTGAAVQQPRTVLFDFISNTVVTAGTTPDADRRYQEFVKQQREQAETAVAAVG